MERYREDRLIAARDLHPTALALSPEDNNSMDLVALTRALIDIESITDNEERVGDFLFEYLRSMADAHGGSVEKMEVAPRRFNVFARWGEPLVTLSTHMDTVPPFFPSREDEQNVWGRGACDTKGIIASMIKAG